MKTLVFSLFLCASVWGCKASHEHDVLELDDSFLERRGDKAWLVKFYAPWCGHCRRLEPVWYQVNSAMRDTDIRVAKADATRYPRLASEFDIRGYPTIKFIQGDRAITYRGDRVRESIMEFAKRAHGPVVRRLSNAGKFLDAKAEHSSDVFFVFIGPNDINNDFLEKYTEVAEIYRVLSYFYAGTKGILPPEYKIKNEPTVLVLKDGKYFEYEPPEGVMTKESLDNFVNEERFLAFPRITSGGMGDLIGLEKKIVMVITETKADEDPKQERLKHLGKTLAMKHRDKYHKHFQFIWMNDPETGNTITMSRPETPYLIVLEPETQYFYLPDDGFDVKKYTLDDAHKFLEQVLEGKSVARGGSGFGQRVKRLFYDIATTVSGIYSESPWLALLVFGVPTLVISVICYALCCMEPIDEDAFYEELAEEARQAQAEKEGLTDAEGQDVLTDDQQPRQRLVGGDKASDDHAKSE